MNNYVKGLNILPTDINLSDYFTQDGLVDASNYVGITAAIWVWEAAKKAREQVDN